ncbi:Gti1/Pac2 family-domain-containing protein [Ganoderma leucocontextum]|nr:Gti1/Pac2 family-domain-containing protein [Ganoderma leucocontextum]
MGDGRRNGGAQREPSGLYPCRRPTAVHVHTPRKPDILRGWIKTAKDAMLVLEAARSGIVPRVTRRFHEAEKRSIIQSGAIFVFTEEESGIKRWTDPYLWTASRMQGCFLMYREREDTRPDTEETPPYRCSTMAPLSEAADQKGDKELEHYILGSWNTGRGLKKNGLMKKTISISIEDTTYHLISYYYPSDVQFACLDISPAMKVSFSQTRTLHGSRGKRGRPSRS